MFRHQRVTGAKSKRFSETALTNPREYLGYLKKQVQRFQLLTEVRLTHDTRSTL
jgi:hypothetical protein